jgi:hypothetical protein
MPAAVIRTSASKPGAGFRYFFKKNWGVRTEVRYTVSYRSFGRILTGVFYQFDREWGFGLQ